METDFQDNINAEFTGKDKEEHTCRSWVFPMQQRMLQDAQNK